MQLNAKQIISIVGAVLSVLMISTTQLTDLFGSGVAKSIVSVSGLVNTILSSVMAVITSNSQTVKDASNTLGVEPIRVNENASAALAAMAVDPNVNNIAPTMTDRVAVEAKAAAGA